MFTTFSTSKSVFLFVCILLLLAVTASSNEQQTGNLQDLDEAVKAGNLELVRQLVDKGVPVGLRNENGSTPLHTACAYGYVDIAAFLIEKDADVNAREPKSEMTPLHAALTDDYAKLVRLLVSNGADVEARAADSFTPPIPIISAGVGFLFHLSLILS